MNILYILLQTPAQGQPAGGGMSGLLMIIMLFVVMWLLMIRPQRKKAKEDAQMREQLKKGDRVVLAGGIYGKIHAVTDTTVEVDIANNTIVTVEKNFIQAVTSGNDQIEAK